MMMAISEFEGMSVAELRKAAGKRNIGSGVWRAGAGKDVLLRALRGEDVGGSVPSPGGLEGAIAAAIAPLLKTSIGREEFDALAEQWIEQSDTIAKQAQELADLRTKLEGGEFASKNGGVSLTVAFQSPATCGRVEGLTHRQLSQVIAWTAAGVPVWLWGGAGSGKTHMARQVAAALKLPIHIISVDPTLTVGKLLGFRSLADGSFVPGFLLTPFRDGGVVMLDEIDTGDPGVLAALNALLANGHYLFPDGVEVARHPNFRVIAGANTKGVGAVAGYTARNRIDAATLDRFAVIELLPDAGLELALVCGGKNESQPWTCAGPLAVEKAESVCRSWVRWVQKVRASAGVSVLISPRASLLGAAALRAGIPVGEVAEALIFKLVSPDTRRNLLAACGQPGC